ncbi:MAG: phosphodiester glycosidase family protein [Bacteroidia bacterium]
MIRIIILATTFLILTLACGQKSLDQAYSAERLKFKDASFDVVKVNELATLEFLSRDENDKPFTSFKAVDASVPQGDKKLVFATNGGIFEPDFMPSGLYIENAKTLSPLNQKKAKGNFYLEPNGVFFIGETEKNILTTQAFAKAKIPCKTAIQSGPMLVIKGAIHPKFNEDSPNKYIRSGVGINAKGQVIFAISNQPVNLYHFASLFKERLGCVNALYLDGAISEMYLPTLGRKDKGRAYGSIIAIWE